MGVEPKILQVADRVAIEHAAARNFTDASEYVRQGAVEKMRADGIEPTQAESDVARRAALRDLAKQSSVAALRRVIDRR